MQQNSLFKSVNCSTCFGWYFTHHQELMTLYLQYLALLRLVLLLVVNVAGRELIQQINMHQKYTGSASESGDF